MKLKEGQLTLSTKFLASTDYEAADTILVGVPMDFTCSFRPGTRFGPQKIREVSIGLEEYSIYSDKNLNDVHFHDCGDLDLPFGNVDKSLDMVRAACKEILEDNKFPLFIGGEHLISVPAIHEVYKKYGNDLAVLHFDAHADLREGYIGCTNSHASAIRRLMDFMPGKNIFQFGIRSGTKDEFEFAKANTNLYPFDVLEPLSTVLPELGNRPVHITLDIDVLDPAFANGTGTPEPGGITSKEMFKVLSMVADINLVGFDIVEVSPVYDTSDRTAILASKIIREIILKVSR